MTETLRASCPECGPAVGMIDAEYGLWTCQDCNESWLLGDVMREPPA